MGLFTLHLRLTGLALALAGLLALAAAGRAAQAPVGSCGLQTTDRIVAVGDVHGALDRFVAILREARLIDERRRWIGGRAVLVQTGDALDRGPDSKEVLDLLRRLENEAARAGGRVVALMGNHEVMRMLHDLRYASAGEYAAFRSFEAEDLRRRFYDLVLPQRRAEAKAASQPFDEAAFRTQFNQEIPLGFVEMRLAFAPDGEYGRWLRQRDVIATINGIAFLHGGTSAAVAPLGCAEINARVKKELQTLSLSNPGLATTLAAGADGPLWYRGLVDGTGMTADEAAAILKVLGVRAIVVGHTVPADRRITAHYGGLVFQIDTGMLAGEFFPEGIASALEIQGDTFTAIYEGRRETLVPGRQGHNEFEDPASMQVSASGPPRSRPVRR